MRSHHLSNSEVLEYPPTVSVQMVVKIAKALGVPVGRFGKNVINLSISELRNMRKIIVEAEVSVDGAMGGENLNFWKQVFPFHSADVVDYLNQLLFMPDALLMGQKTYEFFAQVWPSRQGKDADRMNGMPKYEL